MTINLCHHQDDILGTSTGIRQEVLSPDAPESNRNVTSSDVIDHLPYINILPTDINIFRHININRVTIPSDSQREIITHFVIVFQNIILQNRMILQDSGNFPPLLMHSLNDGSVLIEWIYPDFRIGFSFESNIKESSWYLVSNKHLNEISSSGLLDISEIDVLITFLLRFITSNI